MKLFLGPTLSQNEAQELRKKLQKHEFELDIQIVIDVMKEHPWMLRCDMCTWYAGFVPDFYDKTGLLAERDLRASAPLCKIEERGFKGHPLLISLSVVRIEGGFSYSTKEYTPEEFKAVKIRDKEQRKVRESDSSLEDLLRGVLA